MGIKGSWRRPTQVDDKTVSDNWSRVFKTYATCGDCEGSGKVNIGVDDSNFDTVCCELCNGTGRVEVVNEPE